MKVRFPIRPAPGPWENNNLMPQLIIPGVITGDISQLVNQVNNIGRCLNVVTEIQNMNKVQTSYWIWTIGWTKGWKEAKSYAIKFWEHDIEGSHLEYLTRWFLEEELHIMNSSHRDVILESIGHLTSNTSVGTGSLDEYSRNSAQSSIDSSYWSSATECSTSFMEIGSEWGRMRSNRNLLSESSSQSTGWPQVIPSRGRRSLVLTLKQDAGKGCRQLIADIERKFQDNDYGVMVEPWYYQPNSFIVTFNDCKSMMKALNDADNLGYHLEKRLQKRPTPKNPVKYRVLTRCLIRKGKSKKSKSNGELMRNEIVLVNQLKRRRGRLVKEKRDGSYEAYGWVTVQKSNGLILLEQLDEPK